ncbi:MAG: universal stress protein [Desulfatirhabdiaceae bacterium]
MKILVAYDGSDSGKEALLIASNYAKKLNSTVIVVTSFNTGNMKNQDEIKHAESNLKYAKSFLEKDKIPCVTQMLIRGLSPGEDIVNFAKEEKVELIVIGLKKQSKVGKLLMGSVAQYVILESRCPVLSVNPMKMV